MHRIIVNSIPKSGTHLVERALNLMGISSKPPLFLSSATAERYQKAGSGDIQVGVGMPVLVAADCLRTALASHEANQVVTAHVPYSSGMQAILAELNYRMILIVRDPRDVAVSLAQHISREKTHRLHAEFAALTAEQRIQHAIQGFDGQLENVAQRFRSVLPWAKWENCLMIRFEDLVGSRGGGSDESQRTALDRICRHLGVAKSDGVAEHLFGASRGCVQPRL
jgi:hypothetical protein